MKKIYIRTKKAVKYRNRIKQHANAYRLFAWHRPVSNRY